MAEIHPIIADADRYSIDVSIIITEPLGIRKVRVFDRFGVDIRVVELGCETDSIISTGFFLRERCPFQVEVTECTTGQVTLSAPLFSHEPGAAVPMPCDPLMCHEDPTCRNRQNALILQRNLINRMCANISRYLSNEWMYLALTTLFYALTFLFAALAFGLSFVPYYGIALAIVFSALASLALGYAILFNYWLNRERNARRTQEFELSEARIRFDDIVREILANCCPGCIEVDLGQPRC